jgi:hypothetical protein
MPNAVAAPTRLASSHAADRCRDAADAIARCAATCLTHRAPDLVRECADWCVVACRSLGACADLLIDPTDGPRTDLMIAVARAGLIAAQECAAQCEVHRARLAACATAADACDEAADALQSLLVQLDPFDRGSLTAIAGS